VTAPRRILEVAADDAEGAAEAVQAGADRIELCAALEVGGVTPGPGLVTEARVAVERELIVLARPRRGDFVYDRRMFRALVRDVEMARELGADGVAVGVLDTKGGLDRARTRILVEAAGPLVVTFHRAFDALAAPFAALEVLIDLGVQRVLTSGGARRAVDGATVLAELVRAAANRIEIVAAGGVRASDVSALCDTTGARAVHASASQLVTTAAHTASLAPTHLPAEHELRRVDPGEVRRVRAALDGSRAGPA